MNEELRRGELAGQPGASALALAGRRICPAPIAHRGEITEHARRSNLVSVCPADAQLSDGAVKLAMFP